MINPAQHAPKFNLRAMVKAVTIGLLAATLALAGSDASAANILNANILNANILNANILNANILNANILNANILNGTGSTSGAYRVDGVVLAGGKLVHR